MILLTSGPSPAAANPAESPEWRYRMNRFASMNETVGIPEVGHIGFSLLDENNGCVNGCCCGVSRYTKTEYQIPGCHDDQEGFMVLSGNGYAKLGEEAFPSYKRSQRSAGGFLFSCRLLMMLYHFSANKTGHDATFAKHVKKRGYPYGKNQLLFSAYRHGSPCAD